MSPSKEEPRSLSVPALDPAAHKGDAGRVLSVCGSARMPGAAVLVARAAQRAGAGLVSVVDLDGALRGVLPVAAPEALFAALEHVHDLAFVAASGGFHSIVAGCGLGQGERTEQIVKLLLATASSAPLVFDADALNVLGGVGLRAGEQRERRERAVPAPARDLVECRAAERGSEGLDPRRRRRRAREQQDELGPGLEPGRLQCFARQCVDHGRVLVGRREQRFERGAAHALVLVPGERRQLLVRALQRRAPARQGDPQRRQRVLDETREVRDGFARHARTRGLAGAVAAGRGLALKIDDGANRAMNPLVVELLERFGALAPGAPGLDEWRAGRIQNWAGLDIGRLEIVG